MNGPLPIVLCSLGSFFWEVVLNTTQDTVLRDALRQSERALPKGKKNRAW